MGGLLQPMHLIIILVIVMVIFGPGKLANIGKDLGKGIKDFKNAMNDHDVTPAQPAAHVPTVEQLSQSAQASAQANAQAAPTPTKETA